MKIVVSNPKEGKSFQADVSKDKEGQVIGKKIGDEIDGSMAGATGYTLKITGGSDFSGFPMRSDVTGPKRLNSLLSGRPGFHEENKGERMTKTIRGNMISDETMQVNTVVVKAGDKPLAELMPKTEGKKKEDKR